MLFGGGKIDVAPGKHVLHVKAADIVDAARNVLLQKHRIVAHAVQKAVIVQPHAATDALFPDHDNGVQIGAFQTGYDKQRQLERGPDARFQNFGDIPDGHRIFVLKFRRGFFDGIFL